MYLSKVLLLFLVVGLFVPVNGSDVWISDSAGSVVSGVYFKSSAPVAFMDDLKTLALAIKDRNKRLYKTINCESGWNKNAYNPDDPNGGSWGIAQFQEKTFKQYCMKKYQITDKIDDIRNPKIALECAEKMFKDGLEHHWTCYRKLYGEKK